VPNTGHDHLSAPAGHTIPDTSQNAIGLLADLEDLEAMFWFLQNVPIKISIAVLYLTFKNHPCYQSLGRNI